MKEILKRFRDRLKGVVNTEGKWVLNKVGEHDLDMLNDIICKYWPETYNGKEDRHRTALALLALADDLLNDKNYESIEMELGKTQGGD